MATTCKLPSGQWRAQIRRHGHSLSRTFRLKADADGWVREQESRIASGTDVRRLIASMSASRCSVVKAPSCSISP
jgi:hypothetical protein